MKDLIRDAMLLASQLESNADAHQETPGTERRRAAAMIRSLIPVAPSCGFDMEAYAQAHNDGFDAAVAQQLQDHPGAFAAALRAAADRVEADVPQEKKPEAGENPEGWPYSTDPANAKRCGEAFVGYEDGEGSCEYLPDHPGRHWSARWGSWSL